MLDKFVGERSTVAFEASIHICKYQIFILVIAKMNLFNVCVVNKEILKLKLCPAKGRFFT